VERNGTSRIPYAERKRSFADAQAEKNKKNQLVELVLSELNWFYAPVLVTDVVFFFSSFALRFSLIVNFGFLRSSLPALSLVAIVASLLGELRLNYSAFPLNISWQWYH